MIFSISVLEIFRLRSMHPLAVFCSMGNTFGGQACFKDAEMFGSQVLKSHHGELEKV
jgi:hypothetical protein